MKMDDFLKMLMLVVGFIFCFYFGITFIASIVNLPLSWFRFLYSAFGLYSGLSCLYYSENQKFVYILPMIIIVVISLIVKVF